MITVTSSNYASIFNQTVSATPEGGWLLKAHKVDGTRSYVLDKSLDNISDASLIMLFDAPNNRESFNKNYGSGLSIEVNCTKNITIRNVIQNYFSYTDFNATANNAFHYSVFKPLIRVKRGSSQDIESSMFGWAVIFSLRKNNEVGFFNLPSFFGNQYFDIQ